MTPQRISDFNDRAFVQGYKRGFDAGRKNLQRRGMAQFVHPCESCGAPDGRDPRHARGCPALPEVTRDDLIALARQCERGWAGE